MFNLLIQKLLKKIILPSPRKLNDSLLKYPLTFTLLTIFLLKIEFSHGFLRYHNHVEFSATRRGRIFVDFLPLFYVRITSMRRREIFPFFTSYLLLWRISFQSSSVVHSLKFDFINSRQKNFLYMNKFHCY